MRKSYLCAGFSVFAALFACGDDEGGDSPSNSTVAATCARVCMRSNAAQCSGDVASECQSTCVQDTTQSVPKACSSQLDALNACTVKATFVCNADNEAQPVGCDSQIATFTSCLRANPGATPIGGNDAGTSVPPTGNDAGMGTGNDAGIGTGGDAGLPATGLSCQVQVDDDACDTCGRTSCCAAYAACGTDCQQLLTCASNCVDEACVTACTTQHPVGLTQAKTISDCLDQQCESECSGDDDFGSCLEVEVTPSYCPDPKRPYGYDCAVPPVGDCAASPSGATGVYCCAD